MKWKLGSTAALAAIVAAAGCEPATVQEPAGIKTSSGQSPVPPPPPPPGAAPAAGVVASEGPPTQLEKPTGYFTQAQIEQMLREELGATEISLHSTGQHAFAGTVKTASGETLTITIRLVDGGIKWRHDNGRGGTGSYAWGNPVPD